MEEVDKEINYNSIYDVPNNELLKTVELQLSSIEKAASSFFIRKQRFVDDYDVDKELICLCNEFFGERGYIEHTGLTVSFKKMKEKVQKENLVGLVLCGINKCDAFVNYYTTESMAQIRLTIASITRTLVREYINQEELNELCKATPNFESYISNNSA